MAKLEMEHDGPSAHEAPVGVLEEGSLDPVYEAKAKVLNKAIQDIGMGKYQWQVSTSILFETLNANDGVVVHCHWFRLGYGQSMANCDKLDLACRQERVPSHKGTSKLHIVPCHELDKGPWRCSKLYYSSILGQQPRDDDAPWR
jgi:hypothetical protein